MTLPKMPPKWGNLWLVSLIHSWWGYVAITTRQEKSWTVFLWVLLMCALMTLIFEISHIEIPSDFKADQHFS